MSSPRDFNLAAEKVEHDEGKLHRLLEGDCRPFPGNATLPQFFTKGLLDARIVSNKVAIVQDVKRYTFEDIEVISDLMAGVLKDTVKSFRNLNPDNDSVIAICLPPSPELIFTLFAIEKVGAAYVPIDASFPEDRVFKIIKDCKPILVISDHHTNYVTKFDIVKEQVKIMSIQDLMNQAAERKAQEEALPEEILQEEEEEESLPLKEPLEPLPGPANLAERTAVVLYTSGSSGEPKGVRLSHRVLLNRLNWQWEQYPYNINEICVFKTSMTFVDSVAEIFGPLLQGIPLIVFDKHITAQPTVFIEKISHYKITRVTVVPSLLRAIFQTLTLIEKTASQNLLSSVKLWICSGEPLQFDLLAEFFEIFPRKHTLANFYGSTELTADVTAMTYNSREEAYKMIMDKKVPIGTPIDNAVIYVLDQELNMAEFGEIGEIYVAGYCLCSGYVGGTGSEKFVENPYTRTRTYKTMFKTGDFGRISETQDGSRVLFYEGRVDSQIKVRGQRIDLAEVQLAFSEIKLVSKVAVLCYHPGEEDQLVIAYVVPAESGVTLERLDPMLEKRLKDYERPIIKFVEHIPLLVNGKTDRQRLLTMFETEMLQREEFDDWTSLDLPPDRTEQVKVLLKVMSEVTLTSVETLAENFDNSFFNVGGTSLNAVAVVLKLRQHNLTISIAEFASAKTIRHVLLAISDVGPTETAEEVGSDARSSGGAEQEHDDIASKVGTSHGGTSHALKWTVVPLTDEHKEVATHAISFSFSKKGDLEAYTRAQYEEFRTMIDSIWNDIVGKGLSFLMMRNKDQKMVGASFNFDVYDEPEKINASRAIAYSLDMLEFIESRQRQKLPKGRGKLLHSFMMGTTEDVDQAEAIAIVEAMEDHIIALAEEQHFMGVMTTNTNPLTRQIGVDIHGYEVLNEFQVNKYTAPDGTKPFLLAPDSFTIVCCWKKIPGNQLDFF